MAAEEPRERAPTSRDLFWPYGRRRALLALPVLLLLLTLLLAVVQRIFHWPSADATGLVLVGIFILSFVPLLLSVLDRVAERGGGLELPLVKMNFATVAIPVQPVTIAANIGVAGMPISDSTSQLILDTLRTAVNHDIVVLDLESGQAWWETRLVVLCAGAVRLGHPQVVVFLATEAEEPGRFQGWARPDALLACLFELKPEYQTSLREARQAAAQWAVVAPGQAPPLPLSPLATHGQHVAPFIGGEINDLATEQFLALALGTFETVPFPVSPFHLKGAYSAALHIDAIDQSRPPEEQAKQLLGSDAQYVAITDRGRYLRLLPRDLAQNALLRAIVERDRTPPAA